MLNNSKEYFKRDLRLYRIFAALIAIASTWIGIDLFSGEQCPIVNGLLLNTMIKLCNSLGTGVALSMHVLLSVLIIYSAFNRKTRDKLASKHP